MKIIFFGSGKFAVRVLEALHQGGRDVALVITQPDRKKGRHLLLSATPVKEYALTHQFKIFQPEDINAREAADVLKNERADIFVVVSFGKILSSEILAIPGILPLNIHTSLLPKYRGAAPVNRALIQGEKKTGVTFIKMNAHMDRGEIIFQKALRVFKEDDALTLDERLSRLAAEALNGVLDKIVMKKIAFKKQDESKATYAPLMEKKDGLINWENKGSQILDSFKGCRGWPGSFTFYRGKLLKVLEIAPGHKISQGAAGEIIDIRQDALEVACGKGSILIKEVLPESHHRMSAKSFCAGHPVKIGDKFGLFLP
jgi:methionyl-tRNA formyltransferase